MVRSVLLTTSAVAVLLGTAKFTSRHDVLQQCCSHGLSSISQFIPRIPLVHIGDFCVTQAANPSTNFSVVDGHPAGLNTVPSWKDFKEHLADMQRNSRDAYYHALDVFYATKHWQEEFPDASFVHALAVNYSSAQRDSADGVREIARIHNIVVESITGYVDLLGRGLERQLRGDIGPGVILSEFWLGSVLRLSRFSLLGRVKHDFKVFADYNLFELRRARHSTDKLIHDIEKTENSRTNLLGALKMQYEVYTKTCLKQSNWLGLWRFVTVDGANDNCHRWSHKEVRQLLQQGSKSSLAAAKVHLYALQNLSETLQARYDRVVVQLDDYKHMVESDKSVDVRTFLEIYKDISVDFPRDRSLGW